METMSFRASVVNFEEQDGVLVVGFADDPLATSQYVLLQRTLHPSKQDLQLGMQGLHLEINGPDKSGYDAIDSISLMRDEAVLSLAPKLRSKTGIEKIKIMFNVDDQRFKQLEEQLRMIVENSATLIV